MASLIFREQLPDEHALEQFLLDAIKTHNIPVVEWAFSKGLIDRPGFYWSDIISEVMASDYVEIFDIWRNAALSSGDFSDSINYKCFDRKWSSLMESQVVSLWFEQHKIGNFRQKKASELLRSLASGNCSLVLAEALVACGADVNYRAIKNPANLCPLHYAMRKTSAQAADLVKYLLLSGADPNLKVIRSKGKNKGKEIVLSSEPGAKDISKWLGKTWDELVKWAAEERRQGSKNGLTSASSTLSADKG
ncbi:hypothetical protein FBULB1_2485 [Fusarium bulbicola]|nr:hypothetical protein FBULB1_2485 [Fusarium bulbicola]